MTSTSSMAPSDDRLAKKATKFTRVFVKRLKEGEWVGKRKNLKNIFQHAVNQLPEAGLKTILQSDFSNYLTTVQENVLGTPSTDVPTKAESNSDANKEKKRAKKKKLVENVEPTLTKKRKIVVTQESEEFPYNLYLNKRKLAQGTLSKKKYNATARCLIGQTITTLNPKKLDKLLKTIVNDSDDWACSTHALCDVITGTQNPAALRQAMLQLNRTLVKQGDAILQLKASKLKSTQEALKGFLMFFHYKWSSLTEEFTNPPFADLMAALLSVYADIVVTLSRTSEADHKDALIRGLLMTSSQLVCPEYLYDVILQQTGVEPGDEEALLPFWRYALLTPHNVTVCSGYTKYMCALHDVLSRLEGQAKDGFLTVAMTVAPPTGYLSWLHDLDPAVLSETPLTATSSDSAVTRYLVEEADDDIMEALLNLLTIDESLLEEQVPSNSVSADSASGTGTNSTPLFFFDKTATVTDEIPSNEQQEDASADIAAYKFVDIDDDQASLGEGSDSECEDAKAASSNDEESGQEDEETKEEEEDQQQESDEVETKNREKEKEVEEEEQQQEEEEQQQESDEVETKNREKEKEVEEEEQEVEEQQQVETENKEEEQEEEEELQVEEEQHQESDEVETENKEVEQEEDEEEQQVEEDEEQQGSEEEEQQGSEEETQNKEEGQEEEEEQQQKEEDQHQEEKEQQESDKVETNNKEIGESDHVKSGQDNEVVNIDDEESGNSEEESCIQIIRSMKTTKVIELESESDNEPEAFVEDKLVVVIDSADENAVSKCMDRTEGEVVILRQKPRSPNKMPQRLPCLHTRGSSISNSVILDDDSESSSINELSAEPNKSSPILKEVPKAGPVEVVVDSSPEIESEDGFMIETRLSKLKQAELEMSPACRTRSHGESVVSFTQAPSSTNTSSPKPQPQSLSMKQKVILAEPETPCRQLASPKANDMSEVKASPKSRKSASPSASKSPSHASPMNNESPMKPSQKANQGNESPMTVSQNVNESPMKASPRTPSLNVNASPMKASLKVRESLNKAQKGNESPMKVSQKVNESPIKVPQKVNESPIKASPKTPSLNVNASPMKASSKGRESLNKASPTVRDSPMEASPKANKSQMKTSQKSNVSPMKDSPKGRESPREASPKVKESPLKATAKVGESPRKASPKVMESQKKPSAKVGESPMKTSHKSSPKASKSPLLASPAAIETPSKSSPRADLSQWASPKENALSETQTSPKSKSLPKHSGSCVKEASMKALIEEDGSMISTPSPEKIDSTIRHTTVKAVSPETLETPSKRKTRKSLGRLGANMLIEDSDEDLHSHQLGMTRKALQETHEITPKGSTKTLKTKLVGITRLEKTVCDSSSDVETTASLRINNQASALQTETKIKKTRTAQIVEEETGPQRRSRRLSISSVTSEMSEPDIDRASDHSPKKKVVSVTPRVLQVRASPRTPAGKQKSPRTATPFATKSTKRRSLAPMLTEVGEGTPLSKVSPRRQLSAEKKKPLTRRRSTLLTQLSHDLVRSPSGRKSTK